MKRLYLLLMIGFASLGACQQNETANQPAEIKYLQYPYEYSELGEPYWQAVYERIAHKKTTLLQRGLRAVEFGNRDEPVVNLVFSGSCEEGEKFLKEILREKSSSKAPQFHEVTCSDIKPAIWE